MCYFPGLEFFAVYIAVLAVRLQGLFVKCERHVYGRLFVALLAVMLAAPGHPRYEAAYALALGLAILGAVLLLDVGLVNFGYGMYIAAGAYATAPLYKHMEVEDIAITLLAATYPWVLASFY